MQIFYLYLKIEKNKKKKFKKYLIKYVEQIINNLPFKLTNQVKSNVKEINKDLKVIKECLE